MALALAPLPICKERITVTDGTSEPVVAAKSGDNSIVVDAAGIKVKVKSGGGITVDADGLSASGGTAPGDGQINVNAGNGLEASGDNATANQAGNTTRMDCQGWSNTITVDGDGIKVNTARPACCYPRRWSDQCRCW